MSILKHDSGADATVRDELAALMLQLAEEQQAQGRHQAADTTGGAPDEEIIIASRSSDLQDLAVEAQGPAAGCSAEAAATEAP